MIDEANVVGGVENEKRWAERRGQEISDEDAALRVLNRFLGLFQRAESNMDWSRERGAVNVSMKPNPYFIFPQLDVYKRQEVPGYHDNSIGDRVGDTGGGRRD